MSRELDQLIDNTQDEFEHALAELEEHIHQLKEQRSRQEDLANIAERVEEVASWAFKLKGHCDYGSGLEVARDRSKDGK